MRKAALFSVLGTLALCGPAFSQPDVGTFFIRGSVGFASQSLEDWNDEIDVINETFQGAPVPANFDDFGGANPFGVEVGYQLNPRVALSIGVLRQSDRADNSYSSGFQSVTLNSEVAMTAVTGAFSYWLPNPRGVFLGADAGMGLGTAKQDFSVALPNNVEWTGDWSGNGLVAGAFLGYQYQVQSGLLLHGRMGYQFQNLGEFDGDRVSNQMGFPTSGPPLDLFGEPMDTDFSGVQVLVGIGFAFGGN